ncbi:MAG: TIGR02647 family protein [Sulfuricellaceae bacterium]
MKTTISKLTPEFVAELNFLAHYDLDTMQEGIKVHKDADPAVIAAAQRLHDKKLVTQADGGYMTALGREVAEQLQATLTILAGK